MTRTLCIATHGYPEFPDDLRGNFLRDLAHELGERNVRVIVSTPATGRKGQSSPTADQPNVDVHRFEWGGQGRLFAERSLRSPRDLQALIRLIRMWRRELTRLRSIHSFDGCLAAWALPGAFVAAPVFPTRPFMVWLLGSDVNRFRSGLSRRILKRSLERATTVFAASRDLLQAAESLGVSNPELFPAVRLLSAGEQQTARPPGVARFLYIGRLEPVKGPDVLIEAFAAVRRRSVDAQLRVIGTGTLARSLQESIERHGLRDCVELLGFVHDAEIIRNLQWADALVIPSLSEGMPLVFFEAVQSWKPVIASDVGDIRWFGNLLGSVTVVEPGRIEPLADALASFVHDAPAVIDEARRRQVLQIVDRSRLCDRIVEELNRC